MRRLARFSGTAGCIAWGFNSSLGHGRETKTHRQKQNKNTLLLSNTRTDPILSSV